MKNIFYVFLMLYSFLGHAQNKTILLAGKFFDAEKGQFLSNQYILIEGGYITKVSSGKITADSAEFIDLSTKTVLPGLIDCHTHLTAQPENYMEDLFRKSSIDLAIVAHVYAKKTLEAGFTTIRDLGASDYVDIALRNAINAGKVAGPRMFVAGPFIGSTGSHGDINGFSPNIQFKGVSPIADGIDELKRVIRTNIKYGADLIKFGATAGVLTEEETVGAPQYSQDEMNSIVNEAKMWGKKVAAHAHGADGINMALKAGVASIEHGSFLDDESIQLFLKTGSYLVADIYNDDYILSEYTKLGYPDKIIEKERKVGKTQRENFAKAAKAGVKIAFGTDAGVFPHGQNAKQFFYMTKYGLTVSQALQAATIHAADLIGVKDKLGSLSPGKWADIVAVEGDVEKNIQLLESNVKFVMKEGKVFVNL